jgi:hypothetical protein
MKTLLSFLSANAPMPKTPVTEAAGRAMMRWLGWIGFSILSRNRVILNNIRSSFLSGVLCCLFFAGSSTLQAATYTFSAGGATLSIDLASNESLTVTRSGNDVTFALSSGNFANSGGDNLGSGTSITVQAAQLATLLSITNSASASGSTNNVTFSGNSSLFSTQLTVDITAHGSIGTIALTGGFDYEAGTGGMALSTNRDISLGSGTELSTSSGNITLSANQQATPTTGNFTGVSIGSAAVVSAGGSGTVTVLGRGGSVSSGGGKYGVHVNGIGSQITSNGGPVLVEGTGGSSDSGGGGNIGVYVDFGGAITSTGTGSGATVTVKGFGGNIGGGGHNGVCVNGIGSRISSSGGAVLVEGTGRGTEGGGNHGVYVNFGAAITSTGTGSGATVTVRGFGSTTAPFGGNEGVLVQGTGSQITSNGGAVLVEGFGGGQSGGSRGVSVDFGGIITSAGTGAGATVTVKGTGGLTSLDGSSNHGVNVSGNGARITSSGGQVLVEGTGGGVGASNFNIGVLVESSAQISSEGVGEVNVIGRGGNTSGSGFNNFGVRVNSTNTLITSAGGNVTVEGTGGGAGSGSSNYGVYVSSSGQIHAGGSGTVNVTGQGGNSSGSGSFNYGVFVESNNSQITSGGGAVFVTATGSMGSNPAEALRLQNNAAITSANGAPITITANSVEIVSGASINSGTGTTTIRPRTAGTLINLGGADASGILGLTSAELNLITAGTLVIGRNDIAMGTVTVSSAIAPANAAALQIITARNIVVSANLTSGSGGLTLSANQQATPTAGNFIGVSIGSTAIVSAGGTGTVTALGRGGTGGTFNDGVRIDGASVTSSGGNIFIDGTGGGTTGEGNQNIGVWLRGNSLIAGVGQADVTVKGQGGLGGDLNIGVFMSTGSPKITSQQGSITIEGTGGDGFFSHGVRLAEGLIESAADGSNSATINVTGTKTGDASIRLDGANTRIQSAGAPIFVTGIGSRIDLRNGAQVRANVPDANANITITTNALVISGASNINSGTHTTTLRPHTAGTLIDLGGADADGTLGLTDAELDQVTAGTLILGSANSGDLTVSAAISRPAATNVQLRSGGDVIFNENFNTNGGTLLLAPGNSPAAVKPVFNGTDATASAVSFASDLAIVINGTTQGDGTGATYTQLTVSGNVNLTGVSLVLSGSHAPAFGHTFTIVNNLGANPITGTFIGLPEGAVISNFFGSGLDAIITYLGGTGNDVVLTVACPTITFTATPTPLSCGSTDDGQIAINNEAGGVGPYMYSINNGMSYQSGATFTGLAADTYQVKIKDANGCESAATPVMVTAPVCPAAGALTWTGAVNSDWNNPCNWDAFCVPTTANHVVIPDVTNDPIIGSMVAAVANSVHVQTGGSLTIQANGSVTINGSIGYDNDFFSTGFRNEGMVSNSGQLVLGSTGSVGTYGLLNQAIFHNNSGGEIRIDRSSGIGLYPAAGTFTNAAKITIGANHSVGNTGILNQAIFHNNSGGDIRIDSTSFYGLWNTSGTFTNAAKITIGAISSVGRAGIWNQAAFQNNSGGEISIDRASIHGLWNFFRTFTNKGIVTIGAEAAVGDQAINNQATLTNDTCAQINIYAPLHNVGTLTNLGLLLSNTTMPHTNDGFVNNGLIAYPQGNPIPNVTNNEIIIAPLIANDCDVISPVFSLGSPVDFTIEGIFTDEAATMSAGMYSVGTNTFTPNPVLAEGTRTLYVKITDGSGGCTRIVAWQLTTENCCDAPEALCKPATAVLVGNSASIVVADVDNGSTADCGLQSITVSPGAFNCSHVGTPQTVTLTVTDVKGNSASCQTIVTVQDNTPPSISCPTTQTLVLGADCTATLPDYTGMAAVSDSCGVQSVTQSPEASMTVSGAGNMTVTLTVTDVNGLTNTCDFTVNKVDDTPPSLTCRTATIYLDPTGNYSLLDTDVLDFDASTDNCSAITVTSISPSSFDCDDLMQTFDVLVTAQDDSGNSSTCIASITVFEGTALPQPWVRADVGNPGAGNTYQYSPCSQPPVYTVQAGAANNSQTADNLAVIAQTLCGDFSIEVKIEAVTPNGWAGLTARESTAPGSKMVGMYSNLGSVLRWESRLMNNAPKSINLFQRPFPYWLRLVRQGNLFIGYYSINGSSYSIANIQTIPMGSCLEVGAAAFTTMPGQTVTAVFSNLTASGGAAPISIAPGYAVEPAQAERAARLWPNPAREAFTLELPAAATKTRLRLLNQLGQPLEERRVLPGESRLEWQIGHLSAGVYFVEVLADSPAEDGGRTVLRLVKTD